MEPVGDAKLAPSPARRPIANRLPHHIHRSSDGRLQTLGSPYTGFTAALGIGLSRLLPHRTASLPPLYPRSQPIRIDGFRLLPARAFQSLARFRLLRIMSALNLAFDLI